MSINRRADSGVRAASWETTASCTVSKSFQIQGLTTAGGDPGRRREVRRDQNTRTSCGTNCRMVPRRLPALSIALTWTLRPYKSDGLCPRKRHKRYSRQSVDPSKHVRCHRVPLGSQNRTGAQTSQVGNAPTGLDAERAWDVQGLIAQEKSHRLIALDHSCPWTDSSNTQEVLC